MAELGNEYFGVTAFAKGRGKCYEYSKRTVDAGFDGDLGLIGEMCDLFLEDVN